MENYKTIVFEQNYVWFPYLPVSDNRILGIISDNLCSFMKFTIGLTQSAVKNETNSLKKTQACPSNKNVNTSSESTLTDIITWGQSANIFVTSRF